MVCCAIGGCTNHGRHQKELGILFHRFPKNAEIRLRWINACKRSDQFNSDIARVCSAHFDESDYIRDLQNELLSLPLRRKLKLDAIPHLNLPLCSSTTDGRPNCLKRKIRAEKRNNRKEVKSLLTDSNNVVPDCASNLTENSVTLEITSPHEKITSNNNNVGLDDNNDKNINIDQLLKQLKNERIKNEQLSQEIIVLTEKLNLAYIEISKLKEIKTVFDSTFSQSQKQVLLKRKCSNWSPDDIARAVTLRCLSYKSLGFIRDVLKYPLPSEVTIKRRLRQFTVSPGFIDISLSILKAQTHLFSTFERDVVISYDEMKVSSELCFNQLDERIMGPYNNVQVILIRSLMRKWKQPIYYNFDTAVTKTLLLEAVEVVESCGFKVRAFVSDMGPSNRKVLTDLGVTWSNPSIKNPSCTERNIWVFCDVPHALKLLRNHLLDEGYILSCGKYLCKEPFEKLIEKQNVADNDLQYAPKVTMNHILVSGPERQKVRPASELLSSTVGKAISHIFPEFSFAGEIVQIINDGFDVLNSRIPICGVNPLKSAYGNCLKEQDEALDKLHHLILTMRVKGQKNLLPFQKGFLISINSIRGLFKELKSDGYSYILTYRLNQDVLESYFSQIRGIGRFYDHPLPTTVTQRIKSLILCKNVSEVINSKNCLSEEDVTLSAGKYTQPTVL